jgi:4-amino-4-deoxy-L-arabinose transferase-like glycosyltransferase
MTQRSNILVVILLSIYIGIGSLWLNATPMQGIQLPDNLPASMASETRLYGLGPDEKEHQIYIESFAAGKGIPKPSPDRRTDTSQFVSYQAQHPPLFYAVASIPWKLLSGSDPATRIFAIRWMCLFFGAITIWFSFCITKTAFRSDSAGIVSCAVVAFTPMFGHMHGNISNEPLAMALVSASLYAGIRAKEHQVSRLYIVAGILFGLALVTRLTAGIWLPGLLLITLSRSSLKKAGLLLVPGITVPVLLWMISNQATLGSPLIRTFHRPLLDASHSLGQLMSTGIQIRGAGVTLSLPIIMLWVGGCAAIPMWLMQFHMGLDLVTWSSLSIVTGLVVLLINLDQFSKARRAIIKDVTSESITARLAGLLAILLAVTGLLQQLLYSDWDVVFSTGRYSIAAALGGALLVAGAVYRIQNRRINTAVATVIVIALIAFDVYSVGTVRAFYRDKPTQDAIQYVEKAD